MPTLRIATFNLENVDETRPGQRPSLAERIAVMKPQIVRLRADVACLQEVHGQERAGAPRAPLALRELLAGTDLEGAHVVSTKPDDDAVYDERNLVVVPRLPVLAHRQLRNRLVHAPTCRRLTANPVDSNPVEVTAERPVLHVGGSCDGMRDDLEQPSSVTTASDHWQGGFSLGFESRVTVAVATT
jgi:endonuclease/exonuclease/phosphatase family metal-dependent hydrolase